MSLPTFLGVGASRSGTTALYDLLDRHPEVFMASPKEIHYFSFHHLALGSRQPWTISQYQALFAEAAPARAKGEISPSYLWVPGTAQRIHQALGPIKIIIQLRNPVDRAISDLRYSHSKTAHSLSFRDFLAQAQPLLSSGQLVLSPFHPTAILWKGFYAQQVKSYLDLFGKSRVFIQTFDEMISDTRRFRRALTSFLGIDDDDSLELTRTNESRKNSLITEEDRAQLKDIYRDDILRLGSLIDRDLAHWLR